MLKSLRRIALVILPLVLVLAACNGANENGANGSDQPSQVNNQSNGKQQIEVFHFWTSGSEADAMNMFYNAYHNVRPDVEIVNSAIAGGSGSNSQGVLQTRLAGNDAPDTWLSHPGVELMEQYVEGGFLQPVTDIYEQEGWLEVIPEDAIKMVRHSDGELYAAWVGIHRGNTLFYNKKLLDKHNIQVGSSLSFDEFFAIAEKLKSANIPALCVGDKEIWASVQVFENTLLGVAGSKMYEALFNGTASFDDPKVIEAIETYGKMISYQNADHSSLSWDQAVKKMMEGGCAFNSMGDWVFGELNKMQYKPNVDYGWVSHPGTDGSFIIVADSFTLAKGAKNEQNAKDWLKTIGSKEAQEAFNRVKGSISPRTDIDSRKFSEYQQWSIKTFKEGKLLPTATEGSAAPAAFQQAMYDAAAVFIVNNDAKMMSRALVNAAKDAGMTK
jgi:glucose/mannose transport system substrate-binding protein